MLVACEESQRVCIEFRKLGHEAYSCDIQEPSGGHPEWHILGDALVAVQGGQVFTMDGQAHDVGRWDLLIAHPPCTYLSLVTNRHLSLRCSQAERVVKRMWNVAAAAVFFMQLALADVPRIAVENPRGFMGTLWRPADQTIEPYWFAESEHDSENYVTKKTCLWLKNLAPLERRNTLAAPPPVGYKKDGRPLCWEEIQVGKNRAGKRSKTFPGIARAMAEQWGAQMNFDELEEIER